MKAIGGFFGLDSRCARHYHDKALRLNSARNAFRFLLTNKKYKRIYMPAYCCASLLQSLQNTLTEFIAYHVDLNLEPKVKLPYLQDGEAILYINYFGLKDACLSKLHKKYGEQLIVDNSQAFFSKPIASDVMTFYSPRKWFGVADGAYLYAPKTDKVSLPHSISHDRMLHLLIRVDDSPEAGLEAYRRNEKMLSTDPIQLMSHLTESILGNIDYTNVIGKRKENFSFLHRRLSPLNILSFEEDNAVPMVYPFLLENGDIRKKLMENRIYCAKYWPDTVAPLDEEEEYIRNYLIPLPIDQRYDSEDMDKIIDSIESCI